MADIIADAMGVRMPAAIAYVCRRLSRPRSYGDLFFQSINSRSYVGMGSTLIRGRAVSETGFSLRVTSGGATRLEHGGEFAERTLLNPQRTLIKEGARIGWPDPEPAVEMGMVTELLRRIDGLTQELVNGPFELRTVLTWEGESVLVLRPEAAPMGDLRALFRLQWTLVLPDRTLASGGVGGRYPLTQLSNATLRARLTSTLAAARRSALAQPAPAGILPVVLSNGSAALFFHEAIGHALEADGFVNGRSVFTGKLGAKVGPSDLNISDDGTMQGQRGQLALDDEGVPGQRTPLVQDGVIVGLMHDRATARHCGMAPTGNGRRATYRHLPQPRMTSLCVAPTTGSPEAILSQVRDGIYAMEFSDGSVDLITGQFVFTLTCGYRIRNGQLDYPLRKTTLAGDALSALSNIGAIGADFCLDPGFWTCGKNGQGVPVSMGQPTVLVQGLVVGGSCM